MDKKAVKNVGVTLVLVTLVSFVFVYLPTPKVMAVTAISISPTKGVVGDLVTVNGTIDTANGFFTVRWNQTFNITSGQASDVKVAASFVVPQTIGAPSPSARNVTVELIDNITGTIATANFRLFIVCEIQTKNLAGENITGVLVEVYNATFPNALVMKGNTNATGWIRFNLDAGNHTFKAFVKDVEVGSRSENLTADTELVLPLRLVNVAVAVETEASEGVPSVDVAMKYNYTTRSNNTISEIASMRTNLTGVATIQNLFTNTTYKVEATRYGMLFNSTTLAVEFLPSSPLSLDLTLPTYMLNVHAIDSQSKPADGVQIKVYEWTSGVTTPLQTYVTGSDGDASFLLPFGRYRLIVSMGDAFLNESIVNLVENPVAFTFYLSTANVQVTVSAFDYFGQPIANAEVRIERKIGQEYESLDSKRTDGGRSAAFALNVGGDSRISVYVGDRLVAVKTQFFGTGQNQVTFNISEYVSIFGYPIETGLFTFVSFLLVLIVFVLLLARRRLMGVFNKTLKR